MKKIGCIVGLLMASFGAFSQTEIVLNEPAVIYYMPTNDLVFTIEYDEIIEQKGIFAKYAKEFLYVDAIQETKTHYNLVGIQQDIATRLDYNRPVKVVAQNELPLQYLNFTEDGLLSGYNTDKTFMPVPPTAKMNTWAADYRISDGNFPTPEEDWSNVVLPLFSETFYSMGLDNLALEARKQLLQIREMKLNVLCGEVEHSPSDGRSTELVLQEFERQERILLEAFLGKRKVIRRFKQVTYTPSETQKNAVIAKFSENSGVLEADKKGEPINLAISITKQQINKDLAYSYGDKKDPRVQPSQLFYNLPGHADIKVTYRDKQFVKTTVPLAQFGVALPLAQSLFAPNALPHIFFNPQTGNVKGIIP